MEWWLVENFIDAKLNVFIHLSDERAMYAEQSQLS